MNPEARKKGGFMFSKLGRPAGGAGVNKPGKKQGKKAFFAEGGTVESKSMMKKEIGFMKKKGAPESMIKHEEAEAKGMKRGGMACGGKMKYAAGGTVKPYKPSAGDLNEKSGGDQEMEMRELMRKKAKPATPAPKPKMYARGGGIESHGKTKGTMVRMASGGSVSSRADGVAQRGKTNCKIC